MMNGITMQGWFHTLINHGNNMNIEIERKFLVKNNSWKKDGITGTFYKQGYLSIEKKRTVRVRMGEDHCYLNIKGGSDEKFRLEFEYEIPRKDALVLLNTICIQPIISKTRYLVRHHEFCWEVDEFHEENEGLVLAEAELLYPGQYLQLPDWIGREVTDDFHYYNANLVVDPYQHWKQ